MAELEINDERPSPWQFKFWCNWPEWFRGKFNWRNFTLINAEFEIGVYCGRYVEVSLGLLGFNWRVTWNEPTSTSVWLAEMDQAMAEAREHPEGLIGVTFRECDRCHGSGNLMVRTRDGRKLTDPEFDEEID